MTLIQKYIESEILPTDPFNAILVKKRLGNTQWLKELYTKGFIDANAEVLGESQS